MSFSDYYEHFWYLISDYETLRALDADNVPAVPSMTEEEINALPVHNYKVAGPQKYVPLVESDIWNWVLNELYVDCSYSTSWFEIQLSSKLFLIGGLSLKLMSCLCIDVCL